MSSYDVGLLLRYRIPVVAAIRSYREEFNANSPEDALRSDANLDSDSVSKNLLALAIQV